MELGLGFSQIRGMLDILVVNGYEKVYGYESAWV